MKTRALATLVPWPGVVMMVLLLLLDVPSAVCYVTTSFASAKAFSGRAFMRTRAAVSVDILMQAVLMSASRSSYHTSSPDILQISTTVCVATLHR
jgi:hypothetical protein